MRPRTCRRLTERVAQSLLALLLSPLGAAAADAWSPPLDTALQLAQAKHLPVLLDFHAPWCYASYYMAGKVLTGPEWAATVRAAVVVGIDVDTPEGAYWQNRLIVKTLPSYLVLDEQGRESGRIIHEQTRADFYRLLDPMLARNTTLEGLREDVRGGGRQSLQAARRLLHAGFARSDADGALAWLETLPRATRAEVLADPKARLWVARLRLLKASQSADPRACAAAAPEVLAGDLGCERAYELDRTLRCTATLPADQRKALVAAQKPAMAHLLTSRVFAMSAPSCADVRSEVLSAADLDEVLEYPHARTALLDRAIEDTGRRLAGKDGVLDLKKDRNLADTLRAFLERAGRTAALDTLYPQLVADYPDDYVYAYRYAKNLAARERYAEALPYLQRADSKAYGVNRLEVAELNAQVLIKLGRADAARQVAGDALKANGPWFPEQAARLKALVAGN